MDKAALGNADRIIAALAEQGHGDYSPHREAIAALWGGSTGLWTGNDEAVTDLEDPNFKELRVIQEDHYDQHMDEDERPAWDDMVCYADGYVWFA